MYLLSSEELAERGISWLPRTLDEAVDALEADGLAATVLGDAMHRAWVAEKRAEWNSYHATVSQWERDRYLRFF
jgi:glutamine synthetase